VAVANVRFLPSCCSRVAGKGHALSHQSRAATFTTMPKSFSGGCACGAVRYQVDAEPLLMVNCHCRACQRASGGAYGTGLIVLTAAVKIEGEPRWHE